MKKKVEIFINEVDNESDNDNHQFLSNIIPICKNCQNFDNN